jgi:hypothetical protein
MLSALFGKDLSAVGKGVFQCCPQSTVNFPKNALSKVSGNSTFTYALKYVGGNVAFAGNVRPGDIVSVDDASQTLIHSRQNEGSLAVIW